MLTNYSIAVVIPYYNASKHIISVLDKLPEFITAVIIVNDCSTENIPIQKINESRDFNFEIYFLDNEVNLGVGGATKKGFLFAIEKDFDVVVKIDADDQMDTSYLFQMIVPIVNKKSHVSKGNRFKMTKELKKMPIVRRFGNLGISFLAKIATGYWNNFDPTNGFLVIKTEVLKDINFDNLSDRYFFETSLLSEFYFNNVKIKDFSMPAIYGDEKSSMNVWKMPIIFSVNLTKIFIKRILKSYFLYDFNIGSVYLIFGKFLFLFGVVFGGINWINYSKIDSPTPTGTIMIATISLILGFQLLLQFIQYDIINAPKSIENE